MQKRDDALWEWSVFWQSDQLQSCMPVNEPEASDQLFSCWREFFDALPAGARILDLGTGNGSLATQAVSVSRTKRKRFSIHGVDLADIQPSRFVTSAANLLEEITFHPQTPIEKLPFADDHFDAVASQYAIEYSQTELSLPEALRVLKPGGRFRFLLHADDGVLKDRCRLQWQQAESILESNLFPALADLLEKFVTAESQNTAETHAAAEQAIVALKVVFDDLERQFANSENRSLVDNLFAAVRSVPGMRKSQNLETLLAMTDDIRDLLVAQSKRLQAMQHAALDDTAANAMADQLKKLNAENVTLEHATAGTQRHCIGYWLYGDKSPEKSRVSA
ncbi:MAG: methyltransferase domain-containing protein [Gammaproteobacteria bacterium]|nr:methyltransferase domain-containing protein [Gammaproteobacteria bacterium]